MALGLALCELRHDHDVHKMSTRYGNTACFTLNVLYSGITIQQHVEKHSNRQTKKKRLQGSLSRSAGPSYCPKRKALDTFNA